MVRPPDETLERLVDEQAALRRVATLVARGVRPDEIFAAVSDEVGRLVGTDSATVIRYDDDGEGISYVGSASKVSGAFPVGVHWKFQDGMASFEVYRTGRSARSGAHLITVDGPIGDTHRRMGIVSAVASPIVVEGRLWGAMAVHGQETLPPETEERVEKFTELVATAIANAESRAALTRLAEEQAALRRMATLVARGVRADEIFAAVSNEVGRLVGTDSATVMRFDDDGPGIVFVGVASKMRGAFPLGARWKFEDGMASAVVYRTGRSARSSGQDWSKVEGPVGETHHRLGIASAVASPIVVEGRLWGAIAVQSQGQLPLDTEERLEKFTELLATAIGNAEGKSALARLAEEQAALRRVATLVAQGAPPADVFAAVTNEVGRLLPVDMANMCRYESDDTLTFVASAGKHFPVGSRWPLGGQQNIATLVFKTGRSARIDNYADATGPLAETIREQGIRSGVGTPISVDGRLWGLMAAASNQEQPLPPETEARLASFTGLVATAIANAETRAALAASRARIVAATDETRRRIERDLHDGTQQRLVSLMLELRTVEEKEPPDVGELRAGLARTAEGLAGVVEELREISRGIHPAIVSQGGLEAGLKVLARRSVVPVELDLRAGRRLPEHLEVAVYYVVAEALTNAAKHAQASAVHVELDARNGIVRLGIRDDGIGGADPGKGSGLVGLSDRIEALGGQLEVTSPGGRGTTLLIEMPVELQSSTGSPEP
jgi:signal transduction histidine kinase/uncharacterized protein YoaH (UPF0181 family)